MTTNEQYEGGRARWNPFSLQGRVDRAEYALAGVVLMLVKYAGEAGVIMAVTGLRYTPFDFVSPALGDREPFLSEGPPWLGLAWLAWTIPFVWIAVAMTLRRARDVGVTPWVCLLILVPILNFATMIAMAIAPAKSRRSNLSDDGLAVHAQEDDESDRQLERQLREAWQSPQVDTTPPAGDERFYDTAAIVSAMGGLAVGVVYTVFLMVLSVYGFGSYGAALFFGGPIVTGAAAAYLYNRPAVRTLGVTLGHGMILVICCTAAFLLIGLEGAVCLLMALPIFIPLGLFGSLIGWAIATGVDARTRRDDQGLLGCLLVLPLLASVEPVVTKPADLCVTSMIEINASREEVWRTVVAFPEITAEPEWFFRWGIAAPMRARIEGAGVGAVRHCEFTTGAFVEPITVWDEPRRLAFDVTDQPEPMFELTPYRNLHPPHLTGSFRSSRGEFELIELKNGQTRLIGRTWYTLDIAPHIYWRLWTDEIVHRIHLRVLEHIQQVAEQAPSQRIERT